MKIMNIREEKESDILKITNIHNQAFESKDEGKVVENLRKNNHLLISLVYEIDNEPAGHIAYSPMYYKGKITGIGLGPVGVLPGFQNQGIGTVLTEKGNETAFSEGFSKIFVLGEPEYYLRFGFELAKRYNYFSKFDPEGNYFMVLGKNLTAEGERKQIDYCSEFDV